MGITLKFSSPYLFKNGYLPSIMASMHEHLHKKSSHISLLYMLCGLSSCVLFLQVALILPLASKIKLFTMTQLLQLPTTVIGPIMGYFIISIGLCLLFTTFIWLISINIANFLQLTRPQTSKLCIGVWGLFTTTIFIANQAYFPRTLAADFTKVILAPLAIKILLPILVFLSCGTLLLGMVAFFRKKIWLLVLAAIPLSYGAFRYVHTPFHATFEQPHVIVIGVDSLRLDTLKFFGNQQQLTPHIDQFLTQAKVFQSAVTPLGRTFAAWLSILTGRYPKEHNARYNLTAQQTLKIPHTLPQQLHEHGYETVYASDNKRFSNIDKYYGFDIELGPRIGVNDFLLGLFSAFPLTNFLTNMPLAKWLLPFNYSNRAQNTTYFPHTFTRELESYLAKPRQKPLLLAVHFCLPHWPYIWADDSSTTHQSYNKAIRAADQQFEQLLASLHKYQYLNHAIVVLLSDHGESFMRLNDRITTSQQYQGAPKQASPFIDYINTHENGQLNRSDSHGTDLLSPSQTDILIAFQQYHATDTPTHYVYDFPVSLIDIKPTLLAMLQIPDTTSTGISLAPYLQTPTTPPPAPRPIYMETGFIPPYLFLQTPKLSQLLDIGELYYHINPQGRLEMKPQAKSIILKEKKRAVRYRNWLLANYPDGDHSINILVNTKTHQWTDQLTSEFAKASPASRMLEDLRQFYGDELG